MKTPATNNRMNRFARKQNRDFEPMAIVIFFLFFLTFIGISYLNRDVAMIYFFWGIIGTCSIDEKEHNKITILIAALPLMVWLYIINLSYLKVFKPLNIKERITNLLNQI